MENLSHRCRKSADILSDFFSAAGILPVAFQTPRARFCRALAFHFVLAAVYTSRSFLQRGSRKIVPALAWHRRALKSGRRKSGLFARHRRRTFWNRRASAHQLEAPMEPTAGKSGLTSKINCPL